MRQGAARNGQRADGRERRGARERSEARWPGPHGGAEGRRAAPSRDGRNGVLGGRPPAPSGVSRSRGQLRGPTL